MSSKIVCPKCNKEYTTKFNPKFTSSEKNVFRGKCENCHTMLRFKILANENEQFLKEIDSISFKVNGQIQNVDNSNPLDMTLNEYLRNVLNLKGTKLSCGEGGCGSCVVTGKKFDYTTRTVSTFSVNSCLFPLYSADQWEFTTVEGIGNKSNLHPIQKRLADNNGSQCGYCSPGMVMNMYSLLSNNAKPTKQFIENSFDGHICRCTGYRSILDAMKSFAIDEKPIDIEELHKLKCVDKNKACLSTSSNLQKKIHMIKDDNEWFTPKSLDELYDLLNEYKSLNYRIICGNTSTGIYKNDGPFDILINIQNIPDLYVAENMNSNLFLGSAITLNRLIELFEIAAATVPGFEYLFLINNHLNKVANVSVRNVGSWAGNLLMKHNHNDFPSDVFTCFETIGAILCINDTDKSIIKVKPADFLKLDMRGRFISAVLIPPYDKSMTIIETFKVMPRSQNSHAYINAGFRFNIDAANAYTVTSTPSMVFGGVSATFVHATQTEEFLLGRSLVDPDVQLRAFQILNSEINPNYDPVLASTDYRQSLSVSLFYKFMLTACFLNIDDRYKTAITSVIDTRGVSQAQQNFPTSPNLYPLTQPMTKLNAYAQTSGEAAYVYDMESVAYELHGAFILTTIGNCSIDKIDTSVASTLPGVVRIIFAQDIPGVNNFAPSPGLPEPLFCDGNVLYAGQAVGLVVADTFEQATTAAKAVIITYKNQAKPILTIFDAIEANSFYPKPCPDFNFGDANTAIKTSPHAVNGNCSLGSQYHFYMEGQVAVCKPTEDGLEIHSSTQWLDYVLQSATQVLGIKNSSSIEVKTKQLGGAYGGKITRPNMVSSAAALAASILNKPVRVCLNLNDCMEMVGKRYPWYAEYSVGFDNNGKLNGIKINYYSDAGASPNDNGMPAMYDFSDNAYNCLNWFLSANLAKTHKAANTACRSPGTFPCIAIMEYIMEHVAKYLNKDVLDVRILNLYKKGQITPHGQPLPYFNVDEIITNLTTTSAYEQRVNDVNNYNKANRWKKRGISLVPIKWGAQWSGGCYNSFVAIYNADGSVAIAHGGIESGQGINTKAAQVCAYELGIPIDLINVRKPENLISANSITTGGSITSELVCQALIQCCKQLNQTLDPIRKLMPPNYTWKDLIAKAYGMGADLCSRYWIFPKTDTPCAYNVYGAAVSEALIDVLTGETQILRTDILYDCGQTMNGEIDIGQAEGAFVMGLGFWLFEKLSYDPETGRCLSNGTWEYKPPTTKDIPQDFRITFLNNNPNPLGVLGAKCVGEPPLCLSLSAMFAVKRAIEAARSEINGDRFFVLNSPATVEYVQRACLVDLTQFKFHD